MKLIELAAKTGMIPVQIPYINQKDMPIQSKTVIKRDKSLADFVFHVLITWGKKDIVVRAPAANPNNNFISI